MTARDRLTQRRAPERVPRLITWTEARDQATTALLRYIDGKTDWEAVLATRRTRDTHAARWGEMWSSHNQSSAHQLGR